MQMRYYSTLAGCQDLDMGQFLRKNSTLICAKYGYLEMVLHVMKSASALFTANYHDHDATYLTQMHLSVWQLSRKKCVCDVISFDLILVTNINDVTQRSTCLFPPLS